MSRDPDLISLPVAVVSARAGFASPLDGTTSKFRNSKEMLARRLRRRVQFTAATFPQGSLDPILGHSRD
jgi:hypothetical protein